MHEQDGTDGAGRIARDLVPQEQLDLTLAGPIFSPGKADLYVHRDFPSLRMILSENRIPSPIGVEDMLFGIMAASVDMDVVGLDQLSPAVDFGLDIGAELLRAHHHRVGAL